MNCIIIHFKNLFLISCFLGLFSASAQTVTTLAGSIQGYADGSGSTAQFNTVNGIAVDAAGNVYVADTTNNRIRKITSDGTVTTLAGSTYGYADGIGTSAKFASPTGVAVDAAGNVYVTDTANSRIRKITAAGEVSTFAGGTVGIADGTGIAAQFNLPSNLALDALGNIYVADTYNYRIRKITTGGVVTTLAGSSLGYLDATGNAAQFKRIYGITVASDGTVFVSDSQNNRIRRITPVGVVTTFAGGNTAGSADGIGTAAQFFEPTGIVVDPSGVLYVSDQSNHRVRKITAVADVTTYAGSIEGYADGIGTDARFKHLYGIAIDAAGTLYVGDQLNNKVRIITPLLTTTQYQIANQLVLYPNPAKTILNVQAKEGCEIALINVYNTIGQLVLTITQPNTTIDLSGLKTGNYFLKVFTNKGVSTSKLVKE